MLIKRKKIFNLLMNIEHRISVNTDSVYGVEENQIFFHSLKSSINIISFISRGVSFSEYLKIKIQRL